MLNKKLIRSGLIIGLGVYYSHRVAKKLANSNLAAKVVGDIVKSAAENWKEMLSNSEIKLGEVRRKYEESKARS
jgi:hypothetical protein